MATSKPSRLVPGRYPPPGASPVADAIRKRRGPARGLTPLDGVLLHVPPIAEGWNKLLGAVRTEGNLPGDVRELMILRVAAVNNAAFEWVQHEPVGRAHGLTTPQLYVVRDVSTPLPPSEGILSPLQTSALMFADVSTRQVKVGKFITDSLSRDLRQWVEQEGAEDTEIEARVQDLLVETAAIVATYNMVSRFLVSLDVGGISDDQVPWPVDRKEYFIPIPSPSSPEPTHTIHAITLTPNPAPSAPWLIFANSLLTDLSLWSYLIPRLLADPSAYNILLHSQRGHGLSTLPPDSTHIPHLASDLAYVLAHPAINISSPVHSVIGVSQGGAAALAFAALYPGKTRSVVACDTAPRTPQGNREAWEGRVRMVFGVDCGSANTGDGEGVGAYGKGKEYAEAVGMHALARVTVPRWFPPPSKCSHGGADGGAGGERAERAEWVRGMVARTSVAGFVAGAGALADYDLLHPSDATSGLFQSPVPRVLLVAGALDGGGNVGGGLARLAREWSVARGRDNNTSVQYVGIEDAGHLPMVDEPEGFWATLAPFLRGFC